MTSGHGLAAEYATYRGAASTMLLGSERSAPSCTFPARSAAFLAARARRQSQHAAHEEDERRKPRTTSISTTCSARNGPATCASRQVNAAAKRATDHRHSAVRKRR